VLLLVGVPYIWFGRHYRQLILNHDLIAAIKKSDLPSVKSLIAAGADPNTRDTSETHETLFQTLIHVIHPPLQDSSPTAIFVALDQIGPLSLFSPQAIPVAKVLVTNGANPNVRNQDGEAPITELMDTAWDVDSTQLLDDLLAAGASTEERDVHGHTPIFTACISGEANNVRILLAHGAKPDAICPDGTALMLACAERRTSIVRLLLNGGANPKPKPTTLGTPLSSARDAGDSDIVNILKARGAKE
jgi:ankyrin repeat protein